MSTKREQLIEAALRLFNAGGYRATGIDSILAEAGVAKMTLYKHFRSKDELILSALRREDERQRNWMMREIESRADAPRDRLAVVFEVARDWFDHPEYQGCPFIRAAGEFSDCDDPIHAVCLEHIELFRRYIESLAGSAGASDPGALSRELVLLLTGAMVAAQVRGDSAPAGVAAKAAMTLIDAACS